MLLRVNQFTAGVLRRNYAGSSWYNWIIPKDDEFYVGLIFVPPPKLKELRAQRRARLEALAARWQGVLDGACAVVVFGCGSGTSRKDARPNTRGSG